ncbi:MAG: gamma-glutamyltransferase family protein, partial [Dongiaceae bacterium]
LAELLQPAIERAENGYLVHPRVALDWANDSDRLAGSPAARAVFMTDGRMPKAGDRHHQPALARTLTRIARDGRAAFYEGPVAAEIVSVLQGLGGLHTEQDFAGQRGEYVEPIRTNYRGYDVYECPPNGQGLAALMILNVLSGYEMSGGKLRVADRIHLLAEATKQVYAVRDACFADPRQADIPVGEFLSEAHAARTRAAIRIDKAAVGVSLGETPHKDTVYLCVVDRDGNAISFINSLFDHFGSAILAPGCGVMLHNRGLSFRLDPAHPNCIAPGKRPMHTIIPGMLVKDGKAVMPFGVMGGHYQAVGHAHLLHNMLDRGRDPQEALDAPRSFAHDGALTLEVNHAPEIFTDLLRRGHRVEWAASPLGGGQAIWIDHQRGLLVGGSDPRKDGCALGW